MSEVYGLNLKKILFLLSHWNDRCFATYFEREAFVMLFTGCEATGFVNESSTNFPRRVSYSDDRHTTNGHVCYKTDMSDCSEMQRALIGQRINGRKRNRRRIQEE